MKKLVLGFVAAAVIAAWLSLLVAFQLDLSRGTKIVWVTAVALITEGAIWISAAVAGVAVIQQRQKIFRFLTRPFRKTGPDTLAD